MRRLTRPRRQTTAGVGAVPNPVHRLCHFGGYTRGAPHAAEGEHMLDEETPTSTADDASAEVAAPPRRRRSASRPAGPSG